MVFCLMHSVMCMEFEYAQTRRFLRFLIDLCIIMVANVQAWGCCYMRASLTAGRGLWDLIDSE